MTIFCRFLPVTVAAFGRMLPSATGSNRRIAAVLEWQETTDNCLRYATFARQWLDCKNMAESCKTAYAYKMIPRTPCPSGGIEPRDLTSFDRPLNTHPDQPAPIASNCPLSPVHTTSSTAQRVKARPSPPTCRSKATDAAAPLETGALFTFCHEVNPYVSAEHDSLPAASRVQPNLHSGAFEPWIILSHGGVRRGHSEHAQPGHTG